MASTLSTRALKPSFFTLPPHLRTSAYQHTRPFSSTPPRRLTLVDLAIAAPTTLLNTLHTAGLPWYATLPTTALLVRGLLVYYIAALPARRSARIQSHLVPLASARSFLSHIKKPPPAQEAGVPKNAPPIWADKVNRQFRMFWKRWLELHMLGRAFGAPRFHPRGFVNFGVLIAVTEAIRMKCGSREGLLPLVLGPVEAIARQVDPERFPALAPQPTTTTAGTAEEQLVQRMEQARVVGEDGVTTVDLSQLRPEAVPSVYSAQLDPSLQTEGLSWCIDLTVPDPTFLLPTTLMLLMMANIVFRPTIDNRNKRATPTTTLAPKSIQDASEEAKQTLQAPPHQSVIDKYLPPITNFQRIGLVISMVFWAAMLKMPAAILLYFLPSLVVGWVQQRYLDWKVPVVAPIQACRRPLRLKVRKAV